MVMISEFGIIKEPQRKPMKDNSKFFIDTKSQKISIREFINKLKSQSFDSSSDHIVQTKDLSSERTHKIELNKDLIKYDNHSFYKDLAHHISSLNPNYDFSWLISAQEVHDLYFEYEQENDLDDYVFDFYNNVRQTLKENLISILIKHPKQPAKKHEELWQESHFEAYSESGFSELSEDDVIELIQVIGLKKLLTNYPWTMIVKSAKIWLQKS